MKDQNVKTSQSNILKIAILTIAILVLASTGFIIWFTNSMKELVLDVPSGTSLKRLHIQVPRTWEIKHVDPRLQQQRLNNAAQGKEGGPLWTVQEKYSISLPIEGISIYYKLNDKQVTAEQCVKKHVDELSKLHPDRIYTIDILPRMNGTERVLRRRKLDSGDFIGYLYLRKEGCSGFCILVYSTDQNPVYKKVIDSAYLD